jgi:hypothetical protein
LRWRPLLADPDDEMVLELSVAIENACRERGFSCPVICTPEELMGT